MGKTLISICLPSNRPKYWDDLYKAYDKCNDVDFEFIIAGPNEFDGSLPSNFKHIKTNDIKPPQCCEITIRAAQGSIMHFIGDDTYPLRRSLDDFYREYLRMAEERGNENFYFLPKFKFGGARQSTPYRRRVSGCPRASLCGTLIKRGWIEKIGSIDKRFLGVYWDIDLVMRLYVLGVVPSASRLSISERRDLNIRGQRLCSVSNKYDRKVVDSFWVRDASENEEAPSDTAWCYFFSNDRVLSKYRVKEVESFDNNDIKLRTQGVKKLVKKGVTRLNWI